MKKNNRPFLPRDSGGSAELKEGTGGITEMVGLRTFLEIYKKDVTFKIITPETSDPGRTIPNMPFTASPSAYVGSENEIISRLFIQFSNTLTMFPYVNDFDRLDALEIMHECKNSLLGCEGIYKKLENKLDEIFQEIKRKGVLRDGQTLNPFPHLQNLETEATSFLIGAKKSLQSLVGLFSLFTNANISNPRFDKIIKKLKEGNKQQKQFQKFVEDNLPTIEQILDMRNFLEHPSKIKKTIIENISLSPEGIKPPMWKITGANEHNIISHMKEIIDFIKIFGENFFFFTIYISTTPIVTFRLNNIPEEQVDKNCPIYFKVEPIFLKLETTPISNKK